MFLFEGRTWRTIYFLFSIEVILIHLRDYFPEGRGVGANERRRVMGRLGKELFFYFFTALNEAGCELLGVERIVYLFAEGAGLGFLAWRSHSNQ